LQLGGSAAFMPPHRSYAHRSIVCLGNSPMEAARLMLVLTWAGTIPLKKGERTRLACSPSRLGEDFNPPISSHRTVKSKRAIRVFSQTPNPWRRLFRVADAGIDLGRNDTVEKGERTRLACCPSRLGEDFNPPISSHRTVKTKRVIRVFSQTPNPWRRLFRVADTGIDLGRNDPVEKEERTRLACCPSRLGEDFNPPISSHRTVKTKRVIRVFSRRQILEGVYSELLMLVLTWAQRSSWKRGAHASRVLSEPSRRGLQPTNFTPPNGENEEGDTSV